MDRTENLDHLVHLQGLLIDLDRTMNRISRFLEDTERIKRFELATESIDSEEGKTLEAILVRKLKSPEE
jgi:hypothetical protein